MRRQRVVALHDFSELAADPLCAVGCWRHIVAASDFDAAFAAIDSFMQAVGRAEALRLVLPWTAAKEPAVRAAGLDVLSATAQVQEDLHELALSEAEKVSPEDPDEDLRWSAAHLLGSLRNVPRSLLGDVVQALLRFEYDPDGDVRWQVVFGLPGRTGPGCGPPSGAGPCATTRR